MGAKTLFIAPGHPWENGYCESVNCKLRDELLNGELFYNLKEAQVVIEQWRRHDNRAPSNKRQPSRTNWTGMPVTSIQSKQPWIIN